jgi:hypothetical protein
MKKRFTMREALEDKKLLGTAMSGPSWDIWRVMLIAAMGEALTLPERRIFTQFTGRPIEPCQQVEEAAFVVGRRGGKDRAASVLATYISALCDHSDVLAPGERGLVVCLSLGQRGAMITLDYIAAVFQSTPMLRKLIKRRTADTIELKNGIAIEVRAASFRRIRGITALAVIASEVALWMDESTSSNPDSEIMAAVRPALGTTGGPLIQISTPYARKGELFETYRKHFGPSGDPLVLVAQGTTREFNPTFSQRVVDRALERDPAANRAEYLALFRDDIESLVSQETVDACIVPGRLELPPAAGCCYVGRLDPASGSGQDSMTAAVAYRNVQGHAVLAALREWRPRFSPETVVAEAGALFKAYGISKIVGDRWGGEFVQEPFRRQYNINYEVAERPKSDYYRDLVPLINSKKVELLDHARLISQLCNLERQTARSGKESIDHAPGGHDDLINVAALALVECNVVPWWKREEQQTPTLLPHYVAAREAYYKQLEAEAKATEDKEVESAE